MRIKLFAGAALAAIGVLGLATSTLAAPVVTSGDVNGGYSYSTFNNAGSLHYDNWMINGGAVLPLGSNFAVQGNIGYNQESFLGVNIDTLHGAASGFFAGSVGRLGASVGVGHLTVSGSSGHLDVTTVSAFGDFYGSDRFTASGRVGILIGNGLHNAYYAGGQVVGYILPDLALTGTIDDADLGSLVGTRETDFRVGGEYLVSHSMPLSVSAAYAYNDYKFGGSRADGNTFSVGLKYYIGGSGSLVDHQRSGTEGWAVSMPSFLVF
jgi:hypothetical protein